MICPHSEITCHWSQCKTTGSCFYPPERDAAITAMLRALWGKGLMLQTMADAAKRSKDGKFDSVMEAMLETKQ